MSKVKKWQARVYGSHKAAIYRKPKKKKFIEIEQYQGNITKIRLFDVRCVKDKKIRRKYWEIEIEVNYDI